MDLTHLILDGHHRGDNVVLAIFSHPSHWPVAIFPCTLDITSSLCFFVSPFRIRPESKHQLGTTIPGIHLLATCASRGCWQNSMRSHKPQIAYTVFTKFPLKTCWLCLGPKWAIHQDIWFVFARFNGDPPWQPNFQLRPLMLCVMVMDLCSPSPSLYPVDSVRHFVEPAGISECGAAMLSHLPHTGSTTDRAEGKTVKCLHRPLLSHNWPSADIPLLLPAYTQGLHQVEWAGNIIENPCIRKTQDMLDIS